MARPSRNDWLAFVAVLLLLVSLPAHGYIDPGSGSLILQAAIASALGAALTIKCCWRAIANRLAKLVGADAGTSRTNHGA